MCIRDSVYPVTRPTNKAVLNASLSNASQNMKPLSGYFVTKANSSIMCYGPLPSRTMVLLHNAEKVLRRYGTFWYLSLIHI